MDLKNRIKSILTRVKLTNGFPNGFSSIEILKGDYQCQ